MSLLSGDDWRVGDIDLVVEGNTNTLTSFRQLLTALGDYVLRVKIHDSLETEEPPTGRFATSANGVTSTITKRFRKHITTQSRHRYTAEQLQDIDAAQLEAAMKHPLLPSAYEFQALQRVSSDLVNESKQTFALTTSGYHKVYHSFML
jgi:hypothetical protein